MRIVIVGAGAAGCFCAINTKRRLPDAEIIVLERGHKALAKVAITGGGRCNLTNSFLEVKSIKKTYPRGEKLMKRALKVFSHEDTMEWFEKEGVRLVTQEDQCVFPKSQDAMEIVNTLLHLMRRNGVKLITECKVTNISHNDNSYTIQTEQGDEPIIADAVVVTTGGSPKAGGLSFLAPLNLNYTSPAPSLFTFCVADEQLHSLMGTVVEPVSARLTSTKFQSEGPLLITHWGLSGPAILKLSSYSAQFLAEKDYRAEVSINWLNDKNEQEVAETLHEIQQSNLSKQLSNAYPEQFCQRHWLYIINKVGLPAEKRWQELGPKQMTRLTSMLTNDLYQISGKGQYKEEFVTCGGVSLDNININTMECKEHPGLFFAGEVTDVDAITGGFNLQAAWSMGYIVSQNL